MENLFAVIDVLPTWFVALDGLIIALLGIAALTPTEKDDAVVARVKNLFDKLRSLLVKKND
jgi:type IV secretory pathway TrbD component